MKLTRPPDFIVKNEHGPYLLRWWLIPRNRFFNVYLHKFVAHDGDRVLHCHAWLSLSFLLRGGYYEITPGPDGTLQRTWCRAGSVLFRRAVHRHRIELAIEGEGLRPAWTLFITGPRVREWGFWCPQGFVHWRRFVARDDEGAVGRGCDQ